MAPEQKPAAAKPRVQEPAGPDSITAPESGRDQRLEQRVASALTSSPGAQNLDSYFGISSGNPQQPSAEAQQSDALMEQLRAVTESGGDLGALLGDISAHANSSGADPEALRALMQGSRKKKKAGPGKAG